MKRDKLQLLDDGKALIGRWCVLNQVLTPSIVSADGHPDFDVCAYYRSDVIYIWPHACAAIGMAGMAWSYPGYVVDRTPYGVLAHELGHHVEHAHGAKGGIVARDWKRQTNEAAITSYCPNVNEWFAEIFRLFVTNPTLLEAMRPKIFALLHERWPKRAETRHWTVVLEAVRQRNAAANKVRQAERQAMSETP